VNVLLYGRRSNDQLRLWNSRNCNPDLKKGQDGDTACPLEKLATLEPWVDNTSSPMKVVHLEGLTKLKTRLAGTDH